MQSKQNRRTNRSLNNILLLSVVSLFSCMIGVVLGGGGVWFYGQDAAGDPAVSGSSQPDLSIALPQLGGNAPDGDGFFIVMDGQFNRIPEFQDDAQIDFPLLLSTRDRRPSFAIKGAHFPLGDLALTGYVAGIGVDVRFTQAGAVINSVFERSPAQAANLQPGDVVVSVNGKPVKAPAAYQPGKVDLFGSMQERVELVVMSGASSRTVQIPRTYRDTVDTDFLWWVNSSVKFTLEPKDDYVLLHLRDDLEPGVYRFEFQPEAVMRVGNPFLLEATSTPTQPPIILPLQKWLFVVVE